MIHYLMRRLAVAMVTLLALSIAIFVIIQLPPGDYLTSYIQKLQVSGEKIDQMQIQALRAQYGLDLPMPLQYLKWIGGLLHGDLGQSLEWGRPVSQLIGDRLLMTILVNTSALVLILAVAVPIGIYSATRPYSVGDYGVTVLGYIGLAMPNFLLALFLMVLGYRYFGLKIGGLFSPEYELAPWNVAKVLDLLKHLPVPILVIGMSQMAGIVRVMRSSLMDELKKQYVVTARAKGLSERVLLWKYPVRVAINPIVSTIGWALPGIVSGETITSIVLGLPTMGPLLFRSLLSQDMYLAGSILMLLGVLTILGTLLSDLLLVWVDPRIRLERRAA
jgi:peptide/nickel transport system permease protein